MTLPLDQLDLQRTYSEAEFDALPPLEDDSYYELVEGKLVVSPPAGGQHSDIARILWRHITLFDIQEKLGRAYPPGRFEFGKFKAAPDLFYFVTGRIPVFDQGAITTPADWGVEVWSKSDWDGPVNRSIARAKIQNYLKNGFKLIWAIRPDNNTVEIYQPNSPSPAQILGASDELDGESIIPGFKLKVGLLFV